MPLVGGIAKTWQHSIGSLRVPLQLIGLTRKEGMAGNENTIYRNRILEAMTHTTRFCIAGRKRLAKAAGVSKMAVIRLIDAETNPTYRVVSKVVAAISKDLGIEIDPQELISYEGREWQRPICEVCGCPGCLPDGALRDDGTIDPAYEGVEPGQWNEFRPLSGGGEPWKDDGREDGI